MELKQIGPKTFCIEHDTNIGIHFTDDGRMYLIDTGSKGDGEKIDEILSREGWVPSCIINTHTHIDHIGGNEFLDEEIRYPGLLYRLRYGICSLFRAGSCLYEWRISGRKAANDFCASRE